MANHLHTGDLPEGLDLGASVAVDTETAGLHPARDRLCVVQLSAGDGDAHLVHFPRPADGAAPDYSAPRLRALLADQQVQKIFHFARFDLAVLQRDLRLHAAPVFCTKIASKLVRTYTDRHGLRDLAQELLGVSISKEQQSSDWGAARLTDAQIGYAASDVLHLHALRDRLQAMLEREGRMPYAAACFAFLPTRAALDLAGWDTVDIFAHA
ncbi:MAG: ribonuclease D [Alphaproteobacteria bacterium]